MAKLKRVPTTKLYVSAIRTYQGSRKVPPWISLIIQRGTDQFFGLMIPFFRSFISFFRTFISVLRRGFSFAPWRFLISLGEIGQPCEKVGLYCSASKHFIPLLGVLNQTECENNRFCHIYCYRCKCTRSISSKSIHCLNDYTILTATNESSNESTNPTNSHSALSPRSSQ